MSERVSFPKSAIIVGLFASVLELACVLLVHSSLRASVAVISGQASPGSGSPAWLGWLVVLAEMASVLVLPPVILASAIVCMMHVIANRSFQSPKAVR